MELVRVTEAAAMGAGRWIGRGDKNAADQAAVDDSLALGANGFLSKALPAEDLVRGIEEIAAIDGVDGIFIGPSDLAADLGHLGNAGHPEVQDAIAKACERVRAAGKPAGILTLDAAFAARCMALGTVFTAVGTDGGILSRGADALRASFPA